MENTLIHMRKTMSLEELARMVASGFEKIATKEEMRERFKAVNERFDAANERFNDVELHISSLGSDWRERFDALELRVRRLEQKARA